jgi:hypothetical protein
VFVEYTHPPTHDPAFMSRATFTSVSSPGILAAGNRGFLLESSATVTATLENAPYQFSWCAYAIGVPPNAKLAPDGSYTLLGTPPFTVNGVELADDVTIFGPGTCITSMTDFTYNPDGFFPPPPEVSVTASETTVCSGAEVTFTATATGSTTTAMTYTWNIAGAETTTTTNAYTTTLTDAGEATYTVRVTNANGCPSTVSPAGTVTVNVIPSVTAVSSATICSGSVAALSATASNATTPETYTWVIDGYQATPTTTSTYTTPALTATATYTVQITNATSCTSTVSEAGTITVEEPPTAPTGLTASAATVCTGSPATLTANGGDLGSGAVYEWGTGTTPGSNLLSPATTTEATRTVTVNANSTYWVRLKGAGACPVTAAATATVIVYAALNAGAINATAQSICFGDAGANIAQTTVASGGGGNYTYRWKQNGVVISGATENNYTPPAAALTQTGAHTFTREVQSLCSATDVWAASANQKVITVIALPDTPTNPSSVVICAGNTTTFSASVNTGETIDWYADATDGSALLTNSLSYTPAAALTVTTSYYAQAKRTATPNCLSAARLPVTTTVNPLPVITVAGIPEVPLRGDALTLTASGAGAGGSYCFSFECEQCLYNPFKTGLDLPAEADCRWHSVCTYTETNTFPLTLPEGEMVLWVRAMTAEECVDSTFRIINSYGAGEIETQTVYAVQGYIPQKKEPKSVQPPPRAGATYEWRREGGDSAPLANANAKDYDMADDAGIVNTPGTYTYRRYASGGRYYDGDAPRPAIGTYTLVVVAPPPNAAGTVTKYSEGCETIWSGQLYFVGAGYASVGTGYGYRYPDYRLNEITCPTPWRTVIQEDIGCFQADWETTPGFIPMTCTSSYPFHSCEPYCPCAVINNRCVNPKTGAAWTFGRGVTCATPAFCVINYDY